MALKAAWNSKLLPRTKVFEMALGSSIHLTMLSSARTGVRRPPRENAPEWRTVVALEDLEAVSVDGFLDHVLHDGGQGELSELELDPGRHLRSGEEVVALTAARTRAAVLTSPGRKPGSFRFSLAFSRTASKAPKTPAPGTTAFNLKRNLQEEPPPSHAGRTRAELTRPRGLLRSCRDFAQ